MPVADQEFLASFAVEIDETGVSRLQKVLEDNKKLADELASSFDAASASIRTLSEELGVLPDFSGRRIVTEGASGFRGLSLGLDLSQAYKELDSFTELLKQPVSLKANASGITSAARSALDNIRSMFSSPVMIRAKVEKQDENSGGDGEPVRMSAGGRFTRPTDVQVAEDGDAEYIIPIKKEDRALPLLRQLLAELSPAARESLVGSTGDLSSGGVMAGMAYVGNVTQNNKTVSAPVNIQVHASGVNAEQVGWSLYDTTERYLLRTLKGVFA